MLHAFIFPAVYLINSPYNRSFLRVVDMTHVLNKKAYDESHGRIKSNSVLLISLLHYSSLLTPVLVRKIFHAAGTDKESKLERLYS